MSLVGLDWPVSSYTGWGVFGLHLALAIERQGKAKPVLFHPPAIDLDSVRAARFRAIEVRPLPSAPLDFPVLRALGNDGQRITAIEGLEDRGLIFFENTLFSPQGLAGLGALKTLIAGSAWNGWLLTQAGLGNVAVRPQGVDETLFFPGARMGLWRERFVVFSGGKIELRKGQDIVLKAFARFQARHPEALLVTAWHNFSTDRLADMARSPHGVGPVPKDAKGLPDFAAWATANGLAPDAFLDLGFRSNREMGAILRECDTALFPNRAEGGTNLVAMECLASGLPTILAANTGQLDLTESVPCFPLRRQAPVERTLAGMACAGWGESDLEEIDQRLEAIYADRKGARELGRESAKAMLAWTWSIRAQAVAEALGF
ncbi:MAG: glycosyltransferase [Rhodospirillales bacterium]|nr:glycosyltransferase [Rhodospirillales bacterium]